MASLLRQLYVRLPYPTESQSGKTVIVTGSNIGLGFEAAKHFARLGAATVIIAVRSIEKGESAKRAIEEATQCGPNVVKVWPLNLSSYKSVEAFADRAKKELPRLDILLENAGVAKQEFTLSEGTEDNMNTNVISTFLLAFLMLPQLKETAKRYNIRPVLTIVSSEVHGWAKFEERSAPDGKILETLNDKATAKMEERYPVTKLLEVFGVREIAEKKPDYPITVNTLNPGLCHSELARDLGWSIWFMKLLLARSTEVGSRTLVHAATSGPETHGKYLSDCSIGEVAPLVRSSEGATAQKRVWAELMQKLDTISPGVSQNL